MKQRTFENFLQDIFMELQPGFLDDDLPDAFNAWLGNKDTDEIMEWAELYGREQYIAGKEEILIK